MNKKPDSPEIIELRRQNELAEFKTLMAEGIATAMEVGRPDLLGELIQNLSDAHHTTNTTTKLLRRL